MADKNRIIYLWDDPPFRSAFDPELNPGIDPKTLKCTDNHTQIRLNAPDGSICAVTPNNLSRRKGYSHCQTHYISEHEYCKDDPLFMRWFEPFTALNPDVDIGTIRTDDTVTIVHYIENGERFGNTPYTLVSWLYMEDKWHSERKQFDFHSRLTKWVHEFADLNPGIDPEKLTTSDNKTRLYYRPRGSTGICSITPKELYYRKDWYAPRKRVLGLARDHPGFMELFNLNKDRNPNIDVSTLKVNSHKQLFYRTRDGTVCSISVENLCRRKNIMCRRKTRVRCIDVPGFSEWIKTYRWLNPDIDCASLMVSKKIRLVYILNGKTKEISSYKLCCRKDLLSQIKRIIRGDPLFWTYCIEQDRRMVDSYVKSHQKAYFKMRCPEGHEYTQTPSRFYHYADQGRDPCPYCDGRVQLVPGLNDAVTIDPEIKLFYSEDNDRPAHMVGAYNGKSDFKFKCPYCGHEFAKRMKNIIGKHPKCPKCKDKGFNVPQDKDYMPEGIPFLVIQDDLRPKTRKQ